MRTGVSGNKPYVYNVLPDSNYTCFVVSGLFSPAFCEKLLEPVRGDFFRSANADYPVSYRNNQRLVHDSDVLAAELFEYVKPCLPETLVLTSGAEDEQGTWHIKELNSRLRYCRYHAGQYFHRHLDGVHYRSENVQSKLTFMIYLNDANAFEGGRTLFYRDKNDQEIWASYIPRQGDLIVFDHNLWHEGEEVTAGEKIVLRSDILYRRKMQQPETTPAHHLGYIWKLLQFDHNTLLSAGRDKQIKVWDETGTLKQQWKAHDQSILCLEKMNERLLLSGSRDRKIRMWEKQPGGVFDPAGEMQLHNAAVLTICKLDETHFASAGGDHLIRINAMNGKTLRILEGHTGWVWQLVCIAPGIIASCSEDQTIRLWNYETGELLYSLEASQPVTAMAFEPKSRKLACGYFNGDITVYALDEMQGAVASETFHAHTGIIRSLLFTGETMLASGGEDNTVQLRKLPGGSLAAQFEHTNFVQAVLLKDPQTLLSAAYDGTIRSWHIPDGTAQLTPAISETDA